MTHFTFHSPNLAAVFSFFHALLLNKSGRTARGKLLITSTRMTAHSPSYRPRQSDENQSNYCALFNGFFAIYVRVTSIEVYRSVMGVFSFLLSTPFDVAPHVSRWEEREQNLIWFFQSSAASEHEICQSTERHWTVEKIIVRRNDEKKASYFSSVMIGDAEAMIGSDEENEGRWMGIVIALLFVAGRSASDGPTRASSLGME